MAELVTLKHAVFGVCDVPDTYLDLYPGEWVPVSDKVAAVVEPGNLFDPAAHNLNGDGQDGRELGVLDYLASVADEDERTRVIEAERARGDAARKTVLDWTPST